MFLFLSQRAGWVIPPLELSPEQMDEVAGKLGEEDARKLRAWCVGLDTREARPAVLPAFTPYSSAARPQLAGTFSTKT